MEQFKRWADVPEHYKSKTFCTKERYIIKGIDPVAEVYQYKTRNYIPLYDIRALEKKPERTAEQIEATKRAQETRAINHTCKSCGDIDYKNFHKEIQLCDMCYEYAWRDYHDLKSEISGLSVRLEWGEEETIDEYVILDTETTGLDYDAEIIELGIIDLEGNVLYHSLFKPTTPILPGASEVHKIYDKDLEGAPNFKAEIPKIDKILRDRMILAYNSDFHEQVIRYNYEMHGAGEQAKNYEWDCVMYNEMKIQGSESFISLESACGLYGRKHRAIEDCKLVHGLIVGDRKSSQISLQKAKEKLEQVEIDLGIDDIPF